MREILLALGCVLAVGALAGCIGAEDADPADVASTANTTDPNAEDRDGGLEQEPDAASAANTTDPNPWKAGLDDDYRTPDVAENRSAEERRADVAEPGDPRFAQFDATMQAWMAEHDIPTGQLAVMKDGQLAYESGYGYTDRDETEPANASTMFRLASVTKPMTAALVTMQVEQGLYNWTDPVFCLGEDPAPNCRLPIEPHPDHPVLDDRLADIQVEHLPDHACGFGAEHNLLLFGDGALEVADELDVPPPPSAWRSVQYAMGQELAYAPGEDSQYSNVCYVLAGLVAEAATGAELGALYEAYIFEPLEVDGDIEPGRTRPEDHNPREPFYYCAEKDKNIYDPNETVCEPYGESSLETILAPGGLVATAAATAAVYEVYGHHGSLYDPDTPFAWNYHGGGMPGTSTFAMSLAEGQEISGDLQYVFLFNKREMGEHCDPIQDAPGPLPLAYHTGCDRSRLETAMADLTATWGTGQNTLPAPGATELASGPSAGES